MDEFDHIRFKIDARQRELMGETAGKRSLKQTFCITQARHLSKVRQLLDTIETELSDLGVE